MSEVYELRLDYSQVMEEDPHSVQKIRKDDYVDINRSLARERFSDFDKLIIARANLRVIENYDYVENEMRIPILSSKMCELLNIEDSDFIEQVPVFLVDDLVPPDDIFEPNTINIRSDVTVNRNYYTLNFLRHIDACNLVLSRFLKLKSNPDSIGLLRNPVLKTPAGGFPNIFMIKESIGHLFISGTAKEKLEANDIRGCVFEEVEVSQLSCSLG